MSGKNSGKKKKNSYDLRIPQVAIDLISNTTFADLTGCGAQCSFAQSVRAPSACFPKLVYAGERTDNETCAPPAKPSSFDEALCGPYPPAGDWTPVPPTEIDATQIPCSADFLSYGNAFDAASKAQGVIRFTLSQSVAVMNEYKRLLASPNVETDLQKAQLTRSFFLQGSQGTFNPLFAGNGYTATGVGGVFMETSTEFLFSPFNSTLVPPGKGQDSVVLGLNGRMPSAAGTCTQLTPAKP